MLSNLASPHWCQTKWCGIIYYYLILLTMNFQLLATTKGPFDQFQADHPEMDLQVCFMLIFDCG